VLQVPVACTTEQADIPGLYIIHDFVSEQEQQELLAHIDSQPWQHLAKRRVQHYGFKFEYSQRGVDLKQQVVEMPDWTQTIVQRLQVSSWGTRMLVKWHR
jgi:alkylated DNA repair protein alkB family protein 8